MRRFQGLNIPKPPLELGFLEAFGSEALDIEIGAGQGLHAVRYAQENPTRTLIAIERTKNRFAKLQRRAGSHGSPKNLIPLRADAIPILFHFVPDGFIQRLFLLYPNPFPKPTQAHRRWHRSCVMQLLERKLKPGAPLTMATNLEWYALEAKSHLLAQGWSLNEFLTLRDGSRPRTHFEKKYLARGETCWHLQFSKP